MADQRELIREVHRRYCRRTLIWAIVLSVVMLLFGERLISKGLILGALCSIINFSLMAAFIPLRIAPPGRRRSLLVLSSLFLRYALLAAPLVLAHVTGWVSMIGVAAGLFMVQVVILGDHVLVRLRNPLEIN